MTDISTSQLTVSSTDAALPLPISFEADAALLSRAWKAVSAAERSGSFELLITPNTLRLHVDVSFQIDALIPIRNIAGVAPATEIGIELSIEAFSALNSDNLPENITLMLPDVRLEPGYVGELTLDVGDIVTWDYALTSIKSTSIEGGEQTGVPLDPRNVRKLLSQIGRFALDKDVTGNTYATIQIGEGEAVAGSPQIVRSIRMPELSGVELRVDQTLAKKLSGVLNLLNPSDTRLSRTESQQILSDGILTVSLPTSPALHPLATLDECLAILTMAPADWSEASGNILRQVSSSNRFVEVRLEPSSTKFTLSLPVDGGVAIVECPILSTDSALVEPVDLSIDVNAFGKLDTINSAAMKMNVFAKLLSFEQSLDAERCETRVLSRRLNSEPGATFGASAKPS
jgi:hypothetical protein